MHVITVLLLWLTLSLNTSFLSYYYKNDIQASRAHKNDIQASRAHFVICTKSTDLLKRDHVEYGDSNGTSAVVAVYCSICTRTSRYVSMRIAIIAIAGMIKNSFEVAVKP